MPPSNDMGLGWPGCCSGAASCWTRSPCTAPTPGSATVRCSMSSRRSRVADGGPYPNGGGESRRGDARPVAAQSQRALDRGGDHRRWSGLRARVRYRWPGDGDSVRSAAARACGYAGCPSSTRRSAVSQPPSGGFSPPDEPADSGPPSGSSGPGNAFTEPQLSAGEQAAPTFNPPPSAPPSALQPPSPPGAYPPPSGPPPGYQQG